MAELFAEADVIWSKDDSLCYIEDGKFYRTEYWGREHRGKYNGLAVKDSCKLLMTASGSSFRRPVVGFKKSYGKIPLQRFIDSVDYITTISPDLNYPELNGQWLPHTYDVANTPTTWKMSKPLKIVGYLAQLDCKGTHRYLLPTVEKLREEGYKIDLDICSKMKHHKFIKLKSQATLYFGEISEIGVYGMSSIEAIAYGIPIINHISDVAKKQAYPYADYGSAMLQASNLPELYKLLKQILDGEIDLEAVSKKIKQYALDHHDYKIVGKQVKDILERLVQ
jgi:hypothetical protein